ncbi:MAG: hypothetical protein IPL46_24055 [Saprospiraceae bacterium]|nr:hypothetical protein [Saprospiraceae bacterium]
MSQTLKLYIPKVLSENKVVLLKGIGTLRINYRSAVINHDLSIITPPKEEIYFVPADESKIDPVLVKIVELIAQVDREEATDLVYTFMKDLQTELRVHGFLSFPSVGWIKQDRWGSLFFEPASEYISINRYFGLSQVKLPEALSKAEQEVLADLRETVHEGAGNRTYMAAVAPKRRWGFIISSLLVLMVTVAFLWSRMNPGSEIPFSSGEELEQETLDDRSSVDTPLDQEEEEGFKMPVFRDVGPNFIPVFRDLEPIISFTEQDAKECVIIVGAFSEQGNVSRMINRIEGSSYESVIIPGRGLTKVGLRVNCDDDTQNTLDWAKREFDRSAWLYNKPL